MKINGIKNVIRENLMKPNREKIEISSWTGRRWRWWWRKERNGWYKIKINFYPFVITATCRLSVTLNQLECHLCFVYSEPEFSWIIECGELLAPDRFQPQISDNSSFSIYIFIIKFSFKCINKIKSSNELKYIKIKSFSCSICIFIYIILVM